VYPPAKIFTTPIYPKFGKNLLDPHPGFSNRVPGYIYDWNQSDFGIYLGRYLHFITNVHTLFLMLTVESYKSYMGRLRKFPKVFYFQMTIPICKSQGSYFESFAVEKLILVKLNWFQQTFLTLKIDSTFNRLDLIKYCRR
jgi:hypothetical protein